MEPCERQPDLYTVEKTDQRVYIEKNGLTLAHASPLDSFGATVSRLLDGLPARTYGVGRFAHAQKIAHAHPQNIDP